jgi:ribosomal protein S18 acetylase RimI-like enzyme
VDGDELMGYVYYRVESRDENPFQYARQHVYIDQIDVKLKHRRKGVGKQLIKSVIEKANEKGIDKIILDVWGFNKDAQAFFDSQGFTRWIHRMGMIVE